MFIQLIGSYQDSQAGPTMKTIKFKYRDDDIVSLEDHIRNLILEIFDTITNVDALGHGEFIDVYIDGEKVIEVSL